MSTNMGMGTLSEKRTGTNSSGSMGGNPSQTAPEGGGGSSGGGMGDADIAGIIGASAGGLDSITNMVGMFTGSHRSSSTRKKENKSFCLGCWWCFSAFINRSFNLFKKWTSHKPTNLNYPY
jgi:hypothetical protein